MNIFKHTVLSLAEWQLWQLGNLQRTIYWRLLLKHAVLVLPQSGLRFPALIGGAAKFRMRWMSSSLPFSTLPRRKRQKSTRVPHARPRRRRRGVIAAPLTASDEGHFTEKGKFSTSTTLSHFIAFLIKPSLQDYFAPSERLHGRLSVCLSVCPSGHLTNPFLLRLGALRDQPAASSIVSQPASRHCLMGEECNRSRSL